MYWVGRKSFRVWNHKPILYWFFLLGPTSDLVIVIVFSFWTNQRSGFCIGVCTGRCLKLKESFWQRANGFFPSLEVSTVLFRIITGLSTRSPTNVSSAKILTSPQEELDAKNQKKALHTFTFQVGDSPTLNPPSPKQSQDLSNHEDVADIQTTLQ